MFLKFILIFLFISIQKSSSAFVKFDGAIPEDKTNHQDVEIPIRCGLECILQCSIGNHQLDYGCFDKCLLNSPSNCQWKKSSKKDADALSKTVEIENLKGLDQLKNVTIGELCSFPCYHVPEIICELCKVAPEEAKVLTIGEICAIMATSNECKNLPDHIPESQKKFCVFCKSISDLESLEPSSSSESLLNGSKNTSILGEVKDSKHPHCRWIRCCDHNKHVCYEKTKDVHRHRCWDVWCCDYIQYCHRRSSKSNNTEVEQSFSKTIQSSLHTITTSTGNK